MTRTDADIHAGLDAIQADMAGHQRLVGKQVTGEANRELAAGTFEVLARQWSDEQEPPAAVETPTPTPEAYGAEIDGRKYTVDKAATDDVEFRKADTAEQWFIAHAMPRVELLLTKMDTGPNGEPSYHTRLKAVMRFHLHALQLHNIGRIAEALDADKRYQMELISLLEESNRHFGDWKNDPARAGA